MFVRDLPSGHTARVSVGTLGAEANGNSFALEHGGDREPITSDASGEVYHGLIAAGGKLILLTDRGQLLERLAAASPARAVRGAPPGVHRGPLTVRAGTRGTLTP